MDYVNKKTGIVMSFPCPIRGENWEPVEKPVPKTESEPVKPKKAVKKNVGKK